VEDYHVDRMDVEVWQHMKLTITNNSIGLICTHSDNFTVAIKALT
jgi:ethanolamine utilization microcompartment shell protein EutL